MQHQGFGDQPTDTSIEHRWGGRMACHARVGISAEADLVGDGRMRDVSSSGAYIQTVLAVPLYAQVDVAVQDAAGLVRAARRAIVVRTEFDGVGVEWRETMDGSMCPALGCTTKCLAAESRSS